VRERVVFLVRVVVRTGHVRGEAAVVFTEDFIALTEDFVAGDGG
jgi:hypothetical protein